MRFLHDSLANDFAHVSVFSNSGCSRCSASEDQSGCALSGGRWSVSDAMATKAIMSRSFSDTRMLERSEHTSIAPSKKDNLPASIARQRATRFWRAISSDSFRDGVSVFMSPNSYSRDPWVRTFINIETAVMVSYLDDRYRSFQRPVSILRQAKRDRREMNPSPGTSRCLDQSQQGAPAPLAPHHPISATALICT